MFNTNHSPISQVDVKWLKGPSLVHFNELLDSHGRSLSLAIQQFNGRRMSFARLSATELVFS